MALILKEQNNLYFKIDLNGNYVIFKNKTARNTNKKVTDYHDVISKYNEIIDSLYSPERSYYDAEGLIADTTAWNSEENKYIEDVENCNLGNTYPLMSQYIPDVDKTIPKIVETGRLGVFVGKAKTLEEMYTMVKESKIFGECEDA